MAAALVVAAWLAALPYREVWLVDFEFRHDPGERPWPVCMVARELRTGREIRLWRDELLKLKCAPFDVGPNALFVAYAAAAEIGCFLDLGWPTPVNVLDLYFEHRCETNGTLVPYGNGLLGALAQRGLPHIEFESKDAMRNLVVGQKTWTPDERAAILEYCASDVHALEPLLSSMAANVDWPRALFRGRFAAAVAHMERVGVPFDRPRYERFLRHGDALRTALIASVDAQFGVYQDDVFRHELFARYLAKRGIAWPRTPTGRLATDDDTFGQQALIHPELSALRELLKTLDAMRYSVIPVGSDDRARCAIMPFSSITGRNQPRVSEFILALPKWERGFIKPPYGWGLAYIDWVAQEIAIAAALSGDEQMIEHYLTGDPYIAFAKGAGMAPPEATKTSHGIARARAKALFIAVIYGMGADSLAASAAITRAEAAELLRKHRQIYRRFWRWTDESVTQAMLTSRMTTVFGWRRRIGPNPNPRSIANFPMQANGSEAMRVAAIGAMEAGIDVCGPLHDAFLIAAPLDRLDDDVAHMRQIMTRAGNAVTGGLDIGTEAKVVRYPDHYMTEGAQPMWNRVMRLLEEVEAAK